MRPPRVVSESRHLLRLLLGWCSLCITVCLRAVPKDTSKFCVLVEALLLVHCKIAAMKWEEIYRREGRKDQKREGKKWKEKQLICTCEYCTQWMATHHLVESNRWLKIEKKMNQWMDRCLIFIKQSSGKEKSDRYSKWKRRPLQGGIATVTNIQTQNVRKENSGKALVNCKGGIREDKSDLFNKMQC